MNTGEQKTLVVLQPGYLPWLGFFDQLVRCDVFIYYDDVQYDKHGWRNRNRIKAPDGPRWLTVPVQHHGKPRILDAGIVKDQSWQVKHLGTLKQFYKDAPYADAYLPELSEILLRPWDLLVDLDIALIEWMCAKLGLSRPMYRSSQLGIEGGKSERLLALCQRFGATRYLSGNAAKDYLDVDLFRRNGIEVQWQDYEHPVYPQLHGEFIPSLSAIDLILNTGPDSARYLSPLIERKAA